MKTTDPPMYARYLGVDLHKDYVMIGGVNARQELVLPPRRVELDAWPQSGQTHRQGAITKQGRKDLRWVLVEAAWVAVDKSEHWKREFERLTRRMDKNTAIVAIAHKLLIVMWHVLTERAADHHADEKMVATKLMRWSWELTDEQRGGLTSRQFIRYQLMKLKLGDELTHLTYGNMPRRIASVEEVLALKPELQATP